MTNIEKLKELEKIDYNLSIYIRKHKDVLMSVPGATENSVADLIINRIGAIINNGDNK